MRFCNFSRLISNIVSCVGGEVFCFKKEHENLSVYRLEIYRQLVALSVVSVRTVLDRVKFMAHASNTQYKSPISFS